jgi:hypothetical protein
MLETQVSCSRAPLDYIARTPRHSLDDIIRFYIVIEGDRDATSHSSVSTFIAISVTVDVELGLRAF